MFFDTEFLICFAGGRGQARKDRAIAFLKANTVPLYTSRVCWMEFAEGCATLAGVEKHLSDFAIIEIDAAVAWHASRIARELKGGGRHIGDNDVWIAASAWIHDLPLVSNNTRHLGRVPGLRLQAY